MTLKELKKSLNACAVDIRAKAEDISKEADRTNSSRMKSILRMFDTYESLVESALLEANLEGRRTQQTLHDIDMLDDVEHEFSKESYE